MAYEIGAQVYVARSQLELDENAISPFYRTTIQKRQDRSVQVDMPDGSLSKAIATSKVFAKFGVLIIRIGDFNEEGLLDPLAKSILHYCRMLLPGDSVRLIELRTELELLQLWKNFHGLCHQVVIVGHGSQDGFRFGEQKVSADRLIEIFSEPQPSAKEFVSLGCKTGFASFAKIFSKAPCVSHLLAPFHSVHGCAASLFTQTFLHERLIKDCSAKVAFKHARKDLAGALTFRLWVNGSLAKVKS